MAVSYRSNVDISVKFFGGKTGRKKLADEDRVAVVRRRLLLKSLNIIGCCKSIGCSFGAKNDTDTPFLGARYLTR
jgi:hypothetical protein